MQRSRIALCAVYGLVSLLALIGTWSQNLAYFGSTGAGGLEALAQFTLDTRVNPASRSITIDIGLFFLAAAIWMVLEARKHGVRFVYAYVFFGTFVAISVTFPLFLIARERRTASAAGTTSDAAPGSPTKADIVILSAFAAFVLGLCAFVAIG